MTEKSLTPRSISFNGDFWRAVEALIAQGWRMNDFRHAGIEDIFHGHSKNYLVAEKYGCLAGMMPGD